MTIDAPVRAQDPGQFDVVGQRVRPANGVDKCMGSTRYAPDMDLPGALWIKILRSPHARARIVSIDTSEAEAVPGVVAVYTHHNVPREPWGANRDKDQEGVPILADEVQFVGDGVAAVAAEDVDAADEAISRIRVTYEVLPPGLDPVHAAQPNAVQIHPYGNVICGAPGKPTFDNQRGDMEAGFAEADVVIERTFRQPPVHPEPHEPRGCLVTWDGETLIAWDATQALFRTRDMLCTILGIEKDRVRVMATNVGGSFGVKDPPSRYLLLCALTAMRTGRPAKAWFTREEETLDSHMRAGVVHQVKAGATYDGRVVAMQIRTYLDNGHWGGIAAASATGISYARALGSWPMDLYNKIANFRWEVYQVRTNRSGSGPVRSRTSAEALFPLECTMDDLADAIGADPAELRIRHAMRTGDMVEAIRVDGFDPKPIAHVGYAESIRAGCEAIGWDRRRAPSSNGTGPSKRGIGMSGALSQAGTVPAHYSHCELVLNADGAVHLFNATPDQGSEQQTTLRQIVAEVLKMPFGAITSTNADTALCLYDSGPVASRTVFAMGTAVWRATEKLKAEVLSLAAEMAGEPEDRLEVRDGKVCLQPEGTPIATLAEVAGFAGGELRAQGYFKGADEPTYTYGFAASFAEVEVDVETGRVQVLRVVSSHDAGRAINPEIVEGQVEGGVAMGLGYALSEGMVYDAHSGTPLNQWFLDLKTPSTLDTPTVQAVLVELGNDAHPFGAKGCSEISLAGVAPAVRNAIYNATGVRLDELPMTPDRVLKALSASR